MRDVRVTKRLAPLLVIVDGVMKQQIVHGHSSNTNGCATRRSSQPFAIFLVNVDYRLLTIDY